MAKFFKRLAKAALTFICIVTVIPLAAVMAYQSYKENDCPFL